MRAPSIFHSNASGPARRASASATSAAVCASIGATGDISSSWKRASAGSPSASAARATRAEVRGVHGGAAHARGGNRGGRRDRVEHHAAERALTELADQQVQQEVALARGRAREQLAQRVGAPRRGAAPRICAKAARRSSTSPMPSVGSAAGLADAVASRSCA